MRETVYRGKMITVHRDVLDGGVVRDRGIAAVHGEAQRAALEVVELGIARGLVEQDG